MVLSTYKAVQTAPAGAKGTDMTAEDVIYNSKLYADDDFNEHGPDIVEWYEARPVTVPAAVAAGSILGAFALGALTAVGILFLTGQLED
ncbi:hypothetical protein [Brevundimonas sp.]